MVTTLGSVNYFLKYSLAFVFVFVSIVKMGKGVKESVELVMCECKRWLVFSEKKDRKKKSMNVKWVS